MAVERRQLAVLGAILVVLVLVLYWQVTRQDAGPPAVAAAGSVATAAPPVGTAPQNGAAGPIPGVALADLDRQQPEPSDTGRDPFRFGAAPAPKPPVGSPTSGGSQGSRPAPADVPAGPVEPPGPPPIALKFIGFAKQGAAGRLYAVLRDDRGIYYGAEGDVVEGRYRVLRVTADAVDIAYVDGRGRTSLPLSGGQP